MADGGETQYDPVLRQTVGADGVRYDESAQATNPPGVVETPERDEDGENVTIVPDNGTAEVNAGATSPEDAAFAEWMRARRYYMREDGSYGREGDPVSRTSPELAREQYDYMIAEEARQEANPMFAGIGGPDATIGVHEPSLTDRIRNGIYDGLTWLGAEKRTAQFYAGRGTAAAEWVPGPGEAIAADESQRAWGRGDYIASGIYGIGAIPLIGKLGKVFKGVFFARRTPARTPAPAPATPATPPAGATPGATTAVGEPVSVANGEYLETWRDFLVPGTLPLNGARYMGLKLGLPDGYVSPLGPCQISMFDEVFSNPEPGRLLFHQADGRRIGFDRPFNFLPATNSGSAHLELKAPWLKRLQLKDRSIRKDFAQYPDGIYRLLHIEDRNGNALEFLRNAAGLLERVEGPDGLALRFENDGNGRRTGIVLIGTDGSEVRLADYRYDDRGRVVGADCPHAMSVRYGWGADSDQLDWWHDVSKTSQTVFTYDHEGRVIRTRTNGIWDGDTFRYEATGDGEGAGGSTDYLPGGAEEAGQRFEYDAFGNVVSETDALGHTLTHAFDSSGHRVSTTDALGHADSVAYDGWGNVRQHADAEGRETIYGWGPDGELHIVIDPAGHRKQYAHDDRANVVRETDAEGHVTELKRDDRGRVTATHLPDGTVERREWDDHNRLVSVTDAKGHVTRFEYDVFNRRTFSFDPSGGTTRLIYEAGSGGFDTPSRTVRPDGAEVARSYDAQGHMASVTDGEGRRWHYRHGAFGVLESVGDPAGGRFDLGYDIEGRLVDVTNANGAVYTYERDAGGRIVAEVDFDGRRTEYEVDAAGRVTGRTKPDGARLFYAYDKSGRLLRIDPVGADGTPETSTRLWYDGTGLLARAENAAALVEIERDKAGRIVAESVNGERVRTTLDAMGRRTALEIVGADGPHVRATFARDPLGLLYGLTIGEGPDSVELGFERDALGRETARSSGRFRHEQEWDTAGQLVRQTIGSDSVPEASGNLSGKDAPSGIERVYEHDRAFAPVRVQDSRWGDTSYAHDANGQIARTETSEGSRRFDYDAARNLVGATVVGKRAGFGGAAYRDRPSGTWSASAGGVVSEATGADGERIRLEHDVCGRVIRRRVERDGFRPREWSYEWDVHDRLVSCRTLAKNGTFERWIYGYDPFGRRVTKVRVLNREERQAWRQVDPVGTRFVWDGDAMIAEVPLRADGTLDWETATHWHRGDNPHIVLVRTAPVRETAYERAVRLQSGNGSGPPPRARFVHHVVTDHLGTVRELVAGGGSAANDNAPGGGEGVEWSARIGTWGEVRAVQAHGSLSPDPAHEAEAEHAACPWRLPGQYADAETGLHYNRHRHYDPQIGQYASPDPIGLAGGDRPQAYVERPTCWTDPLGLAAAAARTGLYRGDTRDPSVIFAEGFQPRGTSTDLLAHARDNMNPPSHFISTSISVDAAQGFAAGTHVYRIDPRVTGIDVNRTLGAQSPFPHEAEIAVPGSIPTSSIIGAQQVMPGGSLGPLIPNPNYVP